MGLENLVKVTGEKIRNEIRLRTTGVPIWGTDESGMARPDAHIYRMKGVGLVVVHADHREEAVQQDFQDRQEGEAAGLRAIRRA